MDKGDTDTQRTLLFPGASQIQGLLITQIVTNWSRNSFTHIGIRYERLWHRLNSFVVYIMYEFRFIKLKKLIMPSENYFNKMF